MSLRPPEAEFGRRLPDYPTVRLTLEPGQGYRVPRGGMTLVGHSPDQHEPAMLLLISQEETPSA
jgi:hypothetical protein